MKAKIRALTNRKSQQDLGYVLTRLNLVWWRVIRMLMVRHRRSWKDVRRRFTTPDGRWRQLASGEIELFDLAKIAVTRYRWRGNKIPNPWALPDHA